MLKRLANVLFGAWCGAGVYFLLCGAADGRWRSLGIAIAVCIICFGMGWLMKYILVGHGDNAPRL